MNFAITVARIIEPLSYATVEGARLDIPVGPCLVERINREQVDIVWGSDGESSAVLPVEAIKAPCGAALLAGT